MNEEIIGIEVSGEIYPIKDEETSGKIQTLGKEITDINTNLGDLSELKTTDKTNLVSAINEIKQSGGGSSVEKLWENPNPSTGTFGEQSIEIENIKNHNLFIIVWKNGSSESQAIAIPDYNFSMDSLAVSSYYNCYRFGKIDKKNKTLNIQRGIANGSYNDTTSIPLAFYGI